MTKVFDNKINILKALAIMIVVAGHLEFSLIPMFPPYSFQIVLFFFISGMLFNDKYSFKEYFKKRFKSLIVPYFLYAFAYLCITAAVTSIAGKFWGMPVTLKNELLMPFITGHQLDLISPMWFVPQIFISLIVYFILNKLFTRLNLNNSIKFGTYFILALSAIQLGHFTDNVYVLPLIRTLFSLMFIFLGHFYQNSIEGKINIFGLHIFSAVIILQSLIWLTNADYTPIDGIGLSYILAWGEFDNWIVPIITSLTGIWMSLFIVNIFCDYVKDWKFLNKVGQNTYHIMANHLLIFNIITYSALYFKHIPLSVKNGIDIYWFYSPLKTTYLYFVAGLIVTTYLGEFLKQIKKYTLEKINERQ